VNLLILLECLVCLNQLLSCCTVAQIIASIDMKAIQSVARAVAGAGGLHFMQNRFIGFGCVCVLSSDALLFTTGAGMGGKHNFNAALSMLIQEF
jgi:hypothetical protein